MRDVRVDLKRIVLCAERVIECTDGWSFAEFVAASQRWPGANDERVIPSADSHTGSTKSEKVRTALDDLLRQAR